MSLPGTIHQAFVEDKCEHHPDRQAVSVLQSETDSFGAEMHPMCQECLDKYNAEPKTPMVGRCDWCKKDEQSLRPARDYDEGSNGPVYWVCLECRHKKMLAEAQEFAEQEYDETCDIWWDEFEDFDEEEGL